MKGRLAGLGLFGLLAAFLLSREAGRALSPVREGTPVDALSSPPSSAIPSPWPMPGRDPFRYGPPRPEPASSLPRPAARPAYAPPEPSPTPPSVRLVGFVQNAAGLRAALSLDGDVALVGLGESAFGFTVVRLDEDRGVEVRGPDGREAVIAAPPGP